MITLSDQTTVECTVRNHSKILDCVSFIISLENEVANEVQVNSVSRWSVMAGALFLCFFLIATVLFVLWKFDVFKDIDDMNIWFSFAAALFITAFVVPWFTGTTLPVNIFFIPTMAFGLIYLHFIFKALKSTTGKPFREGEGPHSQILL
eukprot:TRINITY_DN24147_c0_g1_i1.p1 TRINITY_DN24147_c0_g1~~TRINITY_DN24147_c0_g1_i1.p1  ORF type:complete len:149 (-),score=11.80 TRINITY_DN24147_c0_g1_i1:5-451(-)